jgi:RNA polymerase sigma factor (sigma-70 family)
MEPNDRSVFVALLAKEHGTALRRYLASRLREAAADIPDLMQEVYLRLLRMRRHDTIRSPQAYLFTVAHHVLHQHKMDLATTPESVDVLDVLAEMESHITNDGADRIDLNKRLDDLNRVLHEISPKARAVFILHRRFGLSLEEVGKQLGVSRPMAKKYLKKALTHCRERLEGME